MILACPKPAALTKITPAGCPFKLDQIVRLAFQRRQSAAPFANLTAIQTLTNWDTLLAAVAGTKVTITPIFANLVIPNSEPQTTGGNDNTTFNGIPQYNGEGFVLVTGTFYNLPAEAKRDMDLYPQESLASNIGATDLTVFPFNKNGQGAAIVDQPLTGYWGIPVYNFRISSRGSAGFNAPDTHQFSFTLPGDWDRYVQLYTPTFDPLTQLIQP
jgi:hypothetical protein